MQGAQKLRVEAQRSRWTFYEIIEIYTTKRRARKARIEGFADSRGEENGRIPGGKTGISVPGGWKGKARAGMTRYDPN
jgi:hypothetical protein